MEDDLISKHLPKWNVTGKNIKKKVAKAKAIKSKPRTVKNKPSLTGSRQFSIFLRPTYYKSGFFNIPVSNESLLADDGAEITINCSNNLKFKGKINRSCNRSGAPRVMGGAKLRDWLQANFDTDEEIIINIISPNEIGLASNNL